MVGISFQAICFYLVMNRDYVSISMIREELRNIPSYALLADFSFRWYQPSDERLWLEIRACATQYNAITPELFDRQFSGDNESLAQRQCYLVDAQGRAIGTATAWFDNNYSGQDYGRVHWVAIVPEMQGKGLAKPLMITVCNRLCELGYERAYLTGVIKSRTWVLKHQA